MPPEVKTLRRFPRFTAVRPPRRVRWTVYWCLEYLFLDQLRVEFGCQAAGRGTRAIRKLQSLGLPIKLCPVADQTWLQLKLLRFYSRLGFRERGPHYLYWKPSTPSCPKSNTKT